jgi:uncharacterized protein YjeT (DUF2065 family)
MRPSDGDRPQTPGRVMLRIAAALVGVVVGLFCFFVCQGMFSAYPQYGTGILSHVGLVLICATGGVAWILDHRRIDDDD